MNLLPSGWGAILAAVNASLNSLSAVLLFSGWLAIRRGDRRLHRNCMIAAFSVSTLFLISYLTRVAISGTHRYPGHGAEKAIYLTLLLSHMTLAIITPPLAIAALYFAFKKRFAVHRKIVRYAFPVWMYVSVTGVVVYLMLYHLPH